MEFNDLLYLGRVTDEERAEWDLYKKGQTVKSKQKSVRKLRKDYVKILENKKRKAAEKSRGTLPDRQKAPLGP